MTDLKAVLAGYLQQQRDALLWKLDGLSERDQRWPRTHTGTNLLGLVKHCAFVELGYFGDCWGRPSPVPYPWGDDPAAMEANLDMYAAEDESAADIIALARLAWQHADATIAEHDLTATATVPWWPAGRNTPTLAHLIVHVIGDLARHAGHADILREQIDGQAGLRSRNDNLPEHEPAWWQTYRARLEDIAAQR